MRPLLRRALAGLILLLTAGCGGQQAMTVPSPTPAPTQTPVVIVIVVTATPLPATPAAATPTVAGASPAPSASATPRTTFQLCGTADPTLEHSIEQLIAGRSFRAQLVGVPGGCAQLSITLTSNGPASGEQSTTLSVGQVSVAITSEGGATHVRLGPASG